MRVERAAAGGAVLSGIAASMCCIGPFVFALVGISGAAFAQRFEPFRPYLLAVTYCLLGGAFYLTYRPQAACGPEDACGMSRANRVGKIVLWIAAIVVVLTTAFPWYAQYLPLLGDPDMRRVFLSCLAGLAVLFPSMAGATDVSKTTLMIKGMTCGGCVAAVKLQLRRTDGVTAYDVSLEKGEADVTYDPAKTDPKKIAASVSETGFAASIEGADESPNGSSTVTTQGPTVKSGRLEPWEPVDAAFKGCSEGVCGIRGRQPQAVSQPGARLGQMVYCPVSGAVFRIKDSSQHVEVNGKTLYLCCEGCARYFAQHRDQVLTLRGLVL